LTINGSWLLRRLLEIILGGLFFYAGLQKHWHPYEFAEAVLAYQLLPGAGVGIAVAVVPWLELTSGLFLAVGLKRRSCLLFLAFLMAGFIGVMLLTLARGLRIDCGCGLFFRQEVGPGAILQDLGLLAWALGLYWWERLKQRGQDRFN
jgi:putative oxidoreductase